MSGISIVAPGFVYWSPSLVPIVSWWARLRYPIALVTPALFGLLREG